MKKLQQGDTLNLVKTGEHIKRIRKIHMDTQIDLANKLNCSQSFVSKLEKGLISMTISTASEICALYGLSIEQLLIINEEDFPEITITI